jgi:hypothetical protein
MATSGLSQVLLPFKRWPDPTFLGVLVVSMASPNRLHLTVVSRMPHREVITSEVYFIAWGAY